MNFEFLPLPWKDDLVAVYHGALFDHVRGNTVKIQTMEYENGELKIAGTFPPNFQNAGTLYVEWGGQRWELQPDDCYSLTKYFGRSAFKQNSFHISLPMPETGGAKLMFTFQADFIRFHPKLRFTTPHARLTEKLKKSYWCFGDYIASLSKGTTIVVRKRTFKLHVRHELRLWKEMLHGKRRKAGLKAVALRALYWATRPFYRRKRIWLTFDKLYKGGDCGEYFYRYVQAQKKDGISMYYVLNKDSLYVKSLRSEGLKPVIRKSLKHRLGFLNAEMIFGTHCNLYNFNAFGAKLEYYFRDLFRFDAACIQHGLTTQAIAM